jgi:hypothetical protein
MIRKYRIAAALVFMCIMALGVFQAAKSFVAALNRPIIYQYFDEALNKLPETLSTVEWKPADHPLDRDFAQNDEAAIGQRLTEAWAAHANALATGNTAYLPDHFSGVALTRARLSAKDRGARMVVLHQTAQPVFYHSDGSVLQIETQALTLRFSLKDGNVGNYRLTTDATVTTLLNEATGWRIFSHERRDAAEVVAPKPATPSTAPLAGINYYPAKTPWSKFWPGFDRDQVAKDMFLIKSLGGNAVRIFLQRDAFLDPTQAPANLENLRILLADAKQAGLVVVPTLFDMRSGYEPGIWPNDYLWLQKVLPILDAAHNVAYVDLKNEPDLDYTAHGMGTVRAWLMTMAAASRQIAPDLPLSIGWSRAERAGDLLDVVDVVTYHDYQSISTSAARLAEVQKLAGNKPVQITEIGASSWSALAGKLPHSEKSQAATLSERLDALQAASGLFVWTLHDFPEPDAKAVGRSPWRKGLQSHFGLFSVDGKEKPSAAVVSNIFTLLLKKE